MITIVGVRFRNSGKTYHFDPGEFELKKGDHVIVDTSKGKEFGTIVLDRTRVDEERITKPLKKVIRVATEEDIKKADENRKKEQDAFKKCLELIDKHNLEMKLTDVEYAFDDSKVLFYFTADGRVDFRELVKDLAAALKSRIELRQIGVRDETKMMGGIGVCGRELCCSTFLSDFVPVSIKMAKQQNLSLNPTKISGMCGRLMCCLKNEQATYEYLRKNMPKKGEIVELPDGRSGKVEDMNILRQLVKVIVEEGDEKELLEYEVERLKFKKHGKKHNAHDHEDIVDETDDTSETGMSEEEKKELEKLETLEN